MSVQTERLGLISCLALNCSKLNCVLLPELQSSLHSFKLLLSSKEYLFMEMNLQCIFM